MLIKFEHNLKKKNSRNHQENLITQEHMTRKTLLRDKSTIIK